MKKDYGPEIAHTIRRGATESFSKLLFQADMPNPVIEGDYTALTYSAQLGNYQSIAVLAARHVDLNEADAAGRNALYLTYQRDWVSAFEALLKGGADPATRTLHGFNMLERIAMTGNTDWGNRVTKYVSGAALDTRDENGNTPLLIALKHARHGVALAYIKAGADVHAVNDKGESCLDFANQYPFQPVFDALAEAAATRGLSRSFNDAEKPAIQQKKQKEPRPKQKKRNQPGAAS